VSAPLRIRRAEPADVELIFSLVVELAEYERARDRVRGTPEQLRVALFGSDPPVAEALIAEQVGLSEATDATGAGCEAITEAGPEPVGFALFYRTFSTWECRPGLWLEDLYVPPEHRRLGVGAALLAEVAAIAIERGYSRLEWSALDWNTPALDFYKRLGAARLDEWVLHRLHGDALEQVASARRSTADA
jgi:GNAT superfamily N-acetyltransferase